LKATGVDMVIEEGSGNVFADLSLPNADALLVKSELALAIRSIVRARGWTQVEAARTLSIPASDMSDLMRGKLARFGRERLEDFLVRLGIDVQIRLTPKAQNRAKARISVAADDTPENSKSEARAHNP
jgi:predicted XRE-type DNA-binding protein